MNRRSWLWLAVAAGTAGCISSKLDPRTRVDATPELQTIIARCVNASPYWETYLDEIGGGGEPVVAFSLAMERRVTRRMATGDYDPGVVDVRFSSTSLRSGRTLYEREATVDIDPVIFGIFDESMTRETIQRKAFEATEKKIYMHVELWVNIAALRAMGDEGTAGGVFLPFLEETANNPWGEHIPDEAGTAMRRIRGN